MQELLLSADRLWHLGLTWSRHSEKNHDLAFPDKGWKTRSNLYIAFYIVCLRLILEVKIFLQFFIKEKVLPKRSFKQRLLSGKVFRRLILASSVNLRTFLGDSILKLCYRFRCLKTCPVRRKNFSINLKKLELQCDEPEVSAPPKGTNCGLGFKIF